MRADIPKVYFMTQDPQKALSESKRVLKDGGVLGCSAWQGSQWLDLMNVLGKVRPDMKLPVLPPEWSDADKMRGELDRAGFKDTVTKKADAYMKYESRDSIVDFICKTMPHMVALMKDMSDEEKSKVKSSMSEELEKICGSEEPGIMHGVALVAAGRK
jgi:ubiquinone/menaquinone biosynthesis C-methylase UbiE